MLGALAAPRGMAGRTLDAPAPIKSRTSKCYLLSLMVMLWLCLGALCLLQPVACAKRDPSVSRFDQAHLPWIANSSKPLYYEGDKYVNSLPELLGVQQLKNWVSVFVFNQGVARWALNCIYSYIKFGKVGGNGDMVHTWPACTVPLYLVRKHAWCTIHAQVHACVVRRHACVCMPMHALRVHVAQVWEYGGGRLHAFCTRVWRRPSACVLHVSSFHVRKPHAPSVRHMHQACHHDHDEQARNYIVAATDEASLRVCVKYRLPCYNAAFLLGEQGSELTNTQMQINSKECE